MAVSTVRRSSAPLATKSSKSNSSGLLTAHSAIEVPASTKLQTTITRWRLHCGLCSGETLQTPLCIYLDLFQRFSEFVRVDWFSAMVHKTACLVQNLLDLSTGTEQRVWCCL